MGHRLPGLGEYRFYRGVLDGSSHRKEARGPPLCPITVCVRASVRAGWGMATCRCRYHRENEAVEGGLCLAAGGGPQFGEDWMCGG